MNVKRTGCMKLIHVTRQLHTIQVQTAVLESLKRNSLHTSHVTLLQETGHMAHPSKHFTKSKNKRSKIKGKM